MAPDGGLYMPCSIPAIPRALFNNIGDMNLREIAFIVASSFLGEDLPSHDIKALVDETFREDIPLVPLGGDMYALELFHGTSMTFKDYGARFMARLLRCFDARRGVRVRNVLVSSTGNSGAATANGLYGLRGLNVGVLFPRGILSRMQMAQFTSLGGNIYPIEVDGSIEDCKRLVREALADPTLADLSLTGGNSINIGRLIPQIVFVFQAYAGLCRLGARRAQEAVYSIPCGNMSNLVAALMGVRMGLPAGGITGVCNVNDSLGRCMRGDKVPAAPVATLAPSLDTVSPSGLPRLLHLTGGNPASERGLRVADAVTDREIAAAVLRLRAEHGYTIDPHGGAALAAANALGIPGVPKVVYATGHPAKYLDIMTRITGSPVELPVQLNRFMNGKRRITHIPATLPALRRCLRTMTGAHNNSN